MKPRVKKRLSAYLTCLMILARFMHMRAQFEKRHTKVKFSRTVFKHLSGRMRIREEFIMDVAECLLEQGWLLISSDDEFGLIAVSTFARAPKMGIRSFSSYWVEINNRTDEDELASYLIDEFDLYFDQDDPEDNEDNEDK